MPRYKRNLRGLEQSELSSEKVLSTLGEILDAVEAGHLHDLWHGDLKPENILLDDFNQVAIADWGMRYFADASTNRYMAPEQQLSHGHGDHRSDLYSLGLIFREFLTGEMETKQKAKSIGRARPELEYLDEIVNSMVDPLPQSRIGSVEEIKRLIALRGEIHLTRQKLDALRKKIVPYHTPDDPLLRAPLYLTGEHDYRSGVLYLKLSQTVTPAWIISFHSLAEGNSVLDKDLHPKNPRTFWFEGDTICNDIDPANAQRLVDHLKELIRLANIRFKADMEAAARSCQEAERKALQQKIEEEKTRLEVIESLKI
jgi:serine/threonine protein kinase